MHGATGADPHRRSPDPPQRFHDSLDRSLIDTRSRVALAALPSARALVHRCSVDVVVDLLIGKTGRDGYRSDDAIAGLPFVTGSYPASIIKLKVSNLFGPLLAPGCGSGCCDFFFVGGDPKSLDLQPFIHVEALLAVQPLHEISRGLANRSSDAAGIDFYRSDLGANLAIFVFQCDVVRVQSDLPQRLLSAGWVCQFSLTHFLDGFSATHSALLQTGCSRSWVSARRQGESGDFSRRHSSLEAALVFRIASSLELAGTHRLLRDDLIVRLIRQIRCSMASGAKFQVRPIGDTRS
jgi:hypothetical protein